jgi:hypothetical protein
MTVVELIEKLKAMPPESVVYIGTECCGCFEPAITVSIDARHVSPTGIVVVDGGDADDHH